MRAIWRICFFIVFFFILFFTVDTIDSVAFAYDSYHWDATTGTVKTSFIMNNTNDGQTELNFEYVYSVNGHSYHSNNINVAGTYFFSSTLEHYMVNQAYYINNYPAGSKITVYYDPAHPSNAAVTQGFTTAHLADVFLILLTLISFGASILYYNKNTRLNSISNTPEMIMITTISNYLALGIAVFITYAFIFIYFIIGAIINVIAFQGMIILLDFLESFLPPVLFIFFPIILFILLLPIVGKILAKGFYSIWIKKNDGYKYYTTYHKIVPDYSSRGYNLQVYGYYKKLDERFNFTHKSKKKFKTEDAAEKFYQKYIDEPDPIRKTNYYLKSDLEGKKQLPKVFSRLLFCSKKDQEENLTLGYQVYSNVFLLALPIIFVIIDLYFTIFYEFWTFSSSHLHTNLIFNYASVHISTILNSTPFIIFLLIILIFETLLLLMVVIVAIKWILKEIYVEKILASHDYWDHTEDETVS